MRRWSTRMIPFAAILLISMGCAKMAKMEAAPRSSPLLDVNASPDQAPASPAYPEALPQKMIAQAGKSRDGADIHPAAGVDESKQQHDRILIYTANVQMSVADIEAALAAAQKITSEAGGYMQSLTGEGITIRVPASSFFRVLDQLRPLGTTLSKQIEAQDVTDEYVDLQLRLKNAEALRDRLQEILGRAQTVKDTLEVEKELNRVREEIERIKGRLASLEKQVRFSTITLSFIKATAPDVKPHRPETPFPWLDRLGVETVLNIGSQHP